jgi:glycosyltransferase involved in cell wall biosynthesis
MTDAPRFSVIMPCFNAGALAVQAIRSVLRQSFTDWELIVVDDGSCDGGGAVLEDWALADPRIRLVALASNGGAAAARNIGIAQARGAYLCFLDADDIFTEDALVAFDAAIGRRAPDLVKAQIVVTHDDADPVARTFGKAFAVPVAEEARGMILSQSDFTSHAYRRDFILDCRIRFDEDLVIGEDRIFLAHAQLWCESFAATDRVVYVYRKQNSVTMEGEWSDQRQLSIMIFLARMRALIDAAAQAKRLRATFFLKSFPWQCRLLGRSARVADRGRVIAHAQALRAAAVAGIDSDDIHGQRFVKDWPPLARKLRHLLHEEDWDAALWTLATEAQPKARAP